MRSLLYILVICFVASCTDVTQSGFDRTLVDRKLDARLAQYRKTISQKCKDEALAKAVRYVDSIIVEEYNLRHLERVDFPSRPVRPTLPEGIILNDSTEIVPEG